MILVTGAYGFIGSKFVKYLNSIGIDDIIVSDYLTNGKQFKNLVGAKFKAFISPSDVFEISRTRIDAVHHFGAISSTTCWDGELVMERNYAYTMRLLSHFESTAKISYSSSASVYGNDGKTPLNLYAYSKQLVDNQVANELQCYKQVQGFRYFNVYSLDDAEWHKGNQASPYYQFKQQALETGTIKLFDGSDTFFRDFIDVDTLCKIQYNMSQSQKSGIFDLGSGTQKSFTEVAMECADMYGAKIEIVPFPEHLKGHYQTNTLADMSYYHAI